MHQDNGPKGNRRVGNTSHPAPFLNNLRSSLRYFVDGIEITMDNQTLLIGDSIYTVRLVSEFESSMSGITK